MKYFSERKFLPLNELLKAPVKQREWELDHFSLTEEQVKSIRMRAMFNMYSNPFAQYDYRIKASDTFTRLCKGKAVWMSNTPMEQGTNRDFLRHAYGDTFLAGLGIGMLVLPLLKAPEVTSLHVVELEEDVIKIFMEAASGLDLSKLTVHHGDAFKPEEFLNGHKFNSLYFDIWKSIDSDNYPETKELYKTYRKHIDYKSSKPFVDFWVRDYIRREWYTYN